MIDEKAYAIAQMDVLAQQLHKIENDRRELQLSYWRWQAMAYPSGECQHGSTHFCEHCGNNSG